MSDTRIDFHIHFDGLGEILAHLVDRSATAKILSLLEQLMSASQSLDQQLADLISRLDRRLEGGSGVHARKCGGGYRSSQRESTPGPAAAVSSPVASK